MVPALLGGPAVRPQGPPAWPLPDEDILQALRNVYADGSWGKYHGVHVERLQAELARYHAVAHALTCASGTFAVELALRALKVGPGDEVLMAAYDYGPNFLSVHAVGARPVLVDVHPHNWNLDPTKIADAVSPATRAVLASHLHGGVAPMRQVMAFARDRGLKVVEDAAQATGGTIQGRKAGTWGDVGILSFGGSKLLTAGRGGALLSDQADVCQRARLGLHRENQVWPLSELQAAVLLPQLAKLDERNAIRKDNVRRLTEALRDVPGLRPFHNEAEDTSPSYYRLGFQFDEAGFGLSRPRFLEAVQAEGTAFNEGFRALHVGRSPSRFRQPGPLDEAGRAHYGCVALYHPVLLGTPDDLAEVAEAVRKIRANAALLAV
jgi:dTDP-4-amino-4,6-dideoxygalactose transaminase